MQEKLVGRDPAAGLSLAEMVGVLWRRRFVVIAATVAGLVVGLAIAKTRPPRFTASGILLVQSQRPSADSSAERIPPEWDVATERDAITSRAMLAAAFASLPDAARAELTASARPLDAALAILFPAPAEIAPSDRQRASTLDAIESGLTVRAGERSLALSVQLTGTSRTATADFVNALMTTYLTERNDRAKQQQSAVLGELSAQRAALQLRISSEAAAIDRLLSTPGSDFALQRAQATVRDLRSASQDLALEAERAQLTVGNVGVDIAAEAVPPARPSGARTLFVLLATTIVFAGSMVIALIARAQRALKRPNPSAG